MTEPDDRHLREWADCKCVDVTTAMRTRLEGREIELCPTHDTAIPPADSHLALNDDDGLAQVIGIGLHRTHIDTDWGGSDDAA